MGLKTAIRAIPLLGPFAAALARRVRTSKFNNSADYWERRYDGGGTSGAGSYNRLAEFKADFLNDFVARNKIGSVVEFGSGDGAQLELATYPCYTGVDISTTAITSTRRRFEADTSKAFLHSSEVPVGLTAELSLSLDVVYHLIEDETFDDHMRALFAAASRFVIIYSSNMEAPQPAPHVRHRRFTDWIALHQPEFVLKDRVANAYPFDEADPGNTSFADFYVFERSQPA